MESAFSSFLKTQPGDRNGPNKSREPEIFGMVQVILVFYAVSILMIVASSLLPL